ncbi:ABC transporter substrate-binding protein [Paenibacillus thalictri]|uniref:Extracellular solute-binding protein n=1 Tax=Paenibacillus thalictri TaxID=2527873 RepID=A0A4V2J3D3_9BACL|nr:ABC transporter substrate-binding protein [Paenibacillus thalictri]TBL71382.1 extracellular solute-binding protein [Paenibacillus thalictri]
MKKIVSLGLAAVLAGSLLAGCGSAPAKDNGKPAAPAASGAANTPTPAPGTDKLVLYTSTPSEILNPVVKEFQDRTKIKVELVTGGTGELYKRVQAESANPMGDVLWGGMADSLEIYKSYFEPYKVKDSDVIAFKSPTNHWTAFNLVVQVIMYNKKLVPDNEAPKSWEDLLDPKWKGKIAFADPSKASTSYIQLATMLTAFEKNGEKGWDYVKKYSKNLDTKLLSGSSAVPKAVADGEFPVGVTYEEAAFRHVVGGAPVGVIYPKEGTSVLPDIAALIKNGKNSENGKKFLDFLVSKDMQEMVSTEFKRRSVRDDVKPTEGLVPAKSIPLVNYDSKWSGEKQGEVLKKFQDIWVGKQ